MEEKEATKIGDYEIKRYYQDGDFFVDLEYHYEEHSSDIGEVIVYIGDKTDLRYGCVMELAAFKCHAHAMKPEFILDFVENILGNGLQEYVFYKHFLFQSDFEKITDADTEAYFDDYGDYIEYNDYANYIYSGHLDRKIKKDLAENLEVDRYKYGKYFFDIVKHDIIDGKSETETYMFKKNDSGKLLCNRFHVSFDDMNNGCCYGLSKNSYAIEIYKSFYNNPSQIRVSHPRFKEIYCKSYDNDYFAPTAPSTHH